MTPNTNRTIDSLSLRFPSYLILKHTIEWLIAACLLVVLFPVMVIAAVLVKLDSRGPVFYTQTRVGRKGRLFRLIKLRSMRPDAEVGTGAVWCQSNDPRITRIGSILRATHIDEFPQLWNVLCGEMSLIGPRPERPEFVQELSLQIDGYEERLLVRPGITGLAQLCLPPDSDLESVRRKIRLDLYYARHVNPWLDFRISVGTATHFLTIFWSLLPVWLRMPDLRDATNDAAVCAAVNRSTDEVPFNIVPEASGVSMASLESNPANSDSQLAVELETANISQQDAPDEVTLLASSSWELSPERGTERGVHGRHNGGAIRRSHVETAVAEG